MLKHILVRDFAIAEDLELDFGTGMSVLSGETGAGKSILLGALGLVLGERADSGSVRHGCRRSEVTATFDLSGLDDIDRWLRERDLETGTECVLRRVVLAAGGSRAYVNGSPVPLQTLRELGGRLVDIHGQHEHQSLLQRDHQRAILDDYAGDSALLSTVGQTCSEWKSLNQQQLLLQSASEEREQRLLLLEFQANELDAIAPTAGEAESLDQEHARLAAAGQLLETTQRTLNQLYEDDDNSIHQHLSRCASDLESLLNADSSLTDLVELLNGATVQVQEASEQLRRYITDLDLDPQRLQSVEARIGALHDLARKHRVEPADLPDLHIRLSEQLTQLKQTRDRIRSLDEELAGALQSYRAAATRLSGLRAKAAKKLSRAVTRSMQELGMTGGQFTVTLDAHASAVPAAEGFDSVEFQVSANPGQPPAGLRKVASGGELSRISLAIQVIGWNRTGVPTLIFDEVDSGIGGATAAVVGRLLRQLGERCQVMCVTHLPQVAAQAHNHYCVTKTTRENHTSTAITALDSDTRIEEIARMLGGATVTEKTRTHAREMIDQV